MPFQNRQQAAEPFNMIRLIVFVGVAVFGGWLDASAQFTDADRRSATISMTRENSCGFVQSDPTDIRQCPDYSITLSGDGTVTYEGRSGVRTIGARAHTIAPDEFHQLLTEFLQADVFSLRDRYDSVTHADGTVTIVGDLPATTFRVSIGGTTKSVYVFYGAPDILPRLARQVDEVAGSQRYTGRPVDRQ